MTFKNVMNSESDLLNRDWFRCQIYMLSYMWY